MSLLTEVSKPLPKLYIWKLKEVYSLIQYGLLNMELPCIGCSIIQSLFPYYINLNLNFPEMVDCEQSLLFPPVIVYRVQKRRPHREWGKRRTGERERKRTFHPILCVACASALGTRLQEGKGGTACSPLRWQSLKTFNNMNWQVFQKPQNKRQMYNSNSWVD